MNEQKPRQEVTALDEPFDQNTLIFHLLLLVNLIAKPFFGRFDKRYGLSLNEWRIMMTLANQPGISISGICDRTGMHIMNASRGVRGLVRKGRVERSVDPADRRRSNLRLSDEGLAVFHEILPSAMEREELLRAGLSPGEADTFQRLLLKLIERVRRGA